MKLLLTSSLAAVIASVAATGRADVPYAKITPLELGPPPSSSSGSVGAGTGLINAGAGMMIGGIAAVPTGFAFVAYAAGAEKPDEKTVPRVWAIVTGCAFEGVGAVVFFTGYFVAQEGKARKASVASSRRTFTIAAGPAPGGGAGLALRGRF